MTSHRRAALLLRIAAVASLLPFALTVADAQAQPRRTGARARPVADVRPPVIPLGHFFDNPEISGAQISPDGRFLSYLKPWKGKLNIHVRPMTAGVAGERRMTADTVRPVVGYFWSADSKYLLYVQDKGGNENFHIYRVPLARRPGAAAAAVPEAKNLTPYEGVRAAIMDVPRDLPDRIFVGLNKRDPSAFDGYWLNLETGDTTLVVRNPGRHLGYMLDDKRGYAVRAAVGSDEKGGTVIHVRTEPDGWRAVATYPASENVTPLRLHPDGRRMYLSSNHGDTDLGQLVLLDLETGTETPIEKDPLNEVDLGAVSFSDVTDSIIATTYVADTVRIYPKTDAFARHLARIRRLHDGTPNVTSRTRDETKWIVAFDSPTDPGATYLYDATTGRATFLFRPRPWLVPRQLAGMKPVSFDARDGLKIHGYLTTPVGVPAKNLPMVLVVHGGPWARDVWGYDAEAQLLANRGYAVLQVNYRGSTGYGKNFYNAAVHEWAGKMHTDLIDGVQWAVRQGIADSSKVAIYGGSYGGYATLVGLTFTPETFACGVDYVGPSSLITLLESFPAYWKPFLEGSFYRHIGNPGVEADREDMRKRSPLFFVDRIVDPLLVVQGANDPRVTKREADQIVTALRDRGVKVQYILAENEGHGFLNADNRLALYRAMELFLKDCLGGRTQQQVPMPIRTMIQKLTVNVDSVKVSAEPKVAEPVAVKVGDALPMASLLKPTSQTFRMILAQAGQEREIGSTQTVVTETTVNGAPAFMIVQTLSSPMIGTGTDTVVVSKATLAPIRERSTNARRTLSLDFDGPRVRGTIKPAMDTAQRVSVDAKEPMFHSAALGLLIRALPLADGYAVKIPAYAHEAGGAITVTSRVIASSPEKLSDGRTVDAWVVETDIAGQKVKSYIAKDSRELMRTVLVAAPGVEVRMTP